MVKNNGKLDADWALFIGGGKRDRLSTAAWERLLKKAITVCRKAGFERIAFCLDSQEDIPVSDVKVIARQLLAQLNDTSLECLFSFDTVPVMSRVKQEKQASLL